MIPLARPDIGEDEIAAIAQVLRGGQLVQGQKVAELEQLLARYLGCAHVVAVSSGTAALHVALLAAGIGPGDEVIVPDFTFPATANAVELCGATPVLADIDIGTFNVDPAHLENLVTARTRAIMPVHEFGCPADMDALSAVARRHGLKIVEDAACALGAEFRGRKVGTLGEAGCFSLHPRKAITTGEGGFVATNDGGMAEKIRLLRNHGMDRKEGKVDFLLAGFNYRMTDFQAAMGIVQMGKLERIVAQRRELAAGYHQALKGAPLALPAEPAFGRHVYQTYHIVLPEPVNRDGVIRALQEQGIGTNYGANALHLLTHHRRFAGNTLYPAAERAYKYGLALPLYSGMEKKDLLHTALSVLGVLPGSTAKG